MAARTSGGRRESAAAPRIFTRYQLRRATAEALIVALNGRVPFGAHRREDLTNSGLHSREIALAARLEAGERRFENRRPVHHRREHDANSCSIARDATPGDVRPRHKGPAGRRRGPRDARPRLPGLRARAAMRRNFVRSGVSARLGAKRGRPLCLLRRGCLLVRRLRAPVRRGRLLRAGGRRRFACRRRGGRLRISLVWLRRRPRPVLRCMCGARAASSRRLDRVQRTGTSDRRGGTPALRIPRGDVPARHDARRRRENVHAPRRMSTGSAAGWELLSSHRHDGWSHEPYGRSAGGRRSVGCAGPRGQRWPRLGSALPAPRAETRHLAGACRRRANPAHRPGIADAG